MQTLIVKINKTDASLSVDRQLVLGSHYQIQFVGLGDGETGTLILSSCRKGKTIAATNEDGVLAINTQEAIDVFERKPNCPYAVTIHAYVIVESATIAESALSLLWSPMQFDINGTPVQFVGPAGPKGDTGPSLYDTWLEMNPEGTWEEFVNEFRGEDGKDGLTLTRDGLYAFTVEGENLYIAANNESVLFGNDEFGNLDRTKPKWKIIGGNLHYIFYKNGKEYTRLNLGSVRGPAGPQGAKGEKGDVGLTEEEKQAISNSINTLDSHITNVANSLDSHTSSQNPHGINPGMIGAVSEETFKQTINTTRVEFAQMIAQVKEKSDAHINATGNVHSLTADDLTISTPYAGNFNITFKDGEYQEGWVWFKFDPFAWQRGDAQFSLKTGEYAGVMANQSIYYSGGMHYCFSDNNRPVFVTNNYAHVISGVQYYIYMVVLDLELIEGESTTAIFFLYSTNGSATSFAEINGFADIPNYAVTEYSYEKSGRYRVLTEQFLRDESTGVAYTLSVNNGELFLRPYSNGEYGG